MKERQGKVAAPVGWQDPRPVKGEQLSQIGGQLYKIGSDSALPEQVENG
jgi:hypothetical protein